MKTIDTQTSRSPLSKPLEGRFEPVATIAYRFSGHRPSPATVWRWCRRGLRGGTVKLNAVFHGGIWLVTEEAFLQFVQDQTDAVFARENKPEDVDDDALRADGLL